MRLACEQKAARPDSPTDFRPLSSKARSGCFHDNAIEPRPVTPDGPEPTGLNVDLEWQRVGSQDGGDGCCSNRSTVAVGHAS